MRIESSYNRSVKIMLDLPYQTHRYLIEPLTGMEHVKRVLIRRFLSFMEKIAKSGKKAIRMLMETSKKDVRSVTGRNFREIMLLVGKTSVESVTKADGNKVEYFPLKQSDKWRVEFIKEIIEIKNKTFDIDNFQKEELQTILTELCTS